MGMPNGGVDRECNFYLAQGIDRCQIIQLVVAGFILPVTVFASTTFAYALNFIINSEISEVRVRSGDSISQIDVDVRGSGSEQQLIAVHNDDTLVALQFDLINNPDSPVSRSLGLLNLDTKIHSLWDEKIMAGLISEPNQVSKDTSSLNGHIIEPGKITDPLSIPRQAFVFLYGPFPFISDPGIAAAIASLESQCGGLFMQ